MKKQLLSMFSALCLALTLLPPMTAQAAESSAVQEVYIGGTNRDHGEGVGVKLDSSTPYYHNGADGALGTADSDPTNANATFDPTSGTLTLNNLDISTANKGIWWKYNDAGKHDLTIALAAGTTNRVVNTNGAAIVGDSGYESGPSLIIEGSGTLNATGYTYGIWVWQNVTIQGDATVIVTGETKCGICNNTSAGTITIKGNAKVTATGATFGVGYDNRYSNVPVIQGGTVTISGGNAAVMQAPDLSSYTGGYKVTVGEDAAGSAEWDGSASLSGNKYLKIEAGQHTHNWDTAWRKDENSHWHDCLNPGCNVTENSNKDGYALHTGGAATCKDKAICSACNQPYGSVDSSNHAGGTEIRDRVDATATTPGYTGDTYCLGCGVKIGTGTTIPATGNAGGSNNPESTTFGFAYDVQRHPAFPEGEGSTMELSYLSEPLLGDGTRKDVYTGEWTLTKAGTYSYLKSYLDSINKDTWNLESVVSAAASAYSLSDEQRDRIVLHELKDGENHIAYGVIIAYDTEEERVVFIGDTWGGGAGYLLSKSAISVSPVLGYGVTAVMNAGDFVFESEYHMLEGMNGEWKQNSNATLSFRADGDFNKFLGVMVDYSLIDAQNYTAVSGSTIVTLKEDYLRTLSVGSHRLTVFYNDGECVAFFKVQEASGGSDEAPTETPAPGGSDEAPAETPAPGGSDEAPAETPAPGGSDEAPAETPAPGGSDEAPADNPESDDNDDDDDDTSADGPATPAVENIPTYATYIVQKGDNLGVIARKCGCSVTEIMAANSNLIKNVNLIYPGWQLKIPQNSGNATTGNTQQGTIVPDAGKTQVYIVKKGDTLWAISRRYGCTSAEIVALNSRLTANPDLLFAGWELIIPQN